MYIAEIYTNKNKDPNREHLTDNKPSKEFTAFKNICLGIVKFSKAQTAIPSPINEKIL